MVLIKYYNGKQTMVPIKASDFIVIVIYNKHEHFINEISYISVQKSNSEVLCIYTYNTKCKRHIFLSAINEILLYIILCG